MKKDVKIIAALLAAALMLTGCGKSDNSPAPVAASPDSSLAETSAPEISQPEAYEPDSSASESSAPESSAPESSSPDSSEVIDGADLLRQAKESLTRGHSVSDYNVTARYVDYDTTTGGLVNHTVPVIDSGQLDELWEMLCEVEAQTPKHIFDSIGGGVNSAEVMLKPAAGGKTVVLKMCIGYYNEGEEGGPTVIVLQGLCDADGDLFYIPAGDVAEGRYSSEWLMNFCKTAEELCGLAPAKPETPASTEPSNIVLITRYQNWAWGVDDRGSFVDKDGDVYSFSFTDADTLYDYDPVSGSDLLETLEKIRADREPEGKADSDAMQQILQLIPEIDTSADVTEEHCAYDAGQTTLYAVRGHEIIALHSSGDYKRELADDAARKIVTVVNEENRKTR